MKTKKIRLWQRDYDIIEDLKNGLHTTSQFAKLYFSSQKKAAERLKLFFQNGLVGRFQKPLLDVRGKPEFVYCQKGKRQQRTYSCINHALAISDCKVWFVCGLKKCEGFGGVFLMGKALPQKIHNGLIVPDFVFTLEKGGKKLLYFGEVDLGTESLASGAGYGFGDKLELYADYFDGGGYNVDFAFLGYVFVGFRVCTVFVSQERQKNFVSIAKEKGADFVLASTLGELLGQDFFVKCWLTFGGGKVSVFGK